MNCDFLSPALSDDAKVLHHVYRSFSEMKSISPDDGKFKKRNASTPLLILFWRE
jgi:hypothetical protein